jgi:hypothetical protein
VVEIEKTEKPISIAAGCGLGCSDFDWNFFTRSRGTDLVYAPVNCGVLDV